MNQWRLFAELERLSMKCRSPVGNQSKLLVCYCKRLRLLAVDAGNTGYGISEKEDPSMQYLGTKDSPAAHVVVSRQFVKQRGW